MLDRELERFARWVRFELPDINNTLYGDCNHSSAQARLLTEGTHSIRRIMQLDWRHDPLGTRLGLLNLTGMFMASCHAHLRRAGRTGYMPEDVDLFADELGRSCGCAPRSLALLYLEHNAMVDGRLLTFTNHPDEIAFIRFNLRGVVGYEAAARAVLRVGRLGIFHPDAPALLEHAITAMEEVAAAMQLSVDPEWFYGHLRLYFDDYEVAGRSWLGPNAGDQGGVILLDLGLGLTSMFGGEQQAFDAYIERKLPCMPPGAQRWVEEERHTRGLLTQLFTALDLDSVDDAEAAVKLDSSGTRACAVALSRICELHGLASGRHVGLVQRHIVKPAQKLGELGAPNGIPLLTRITQMRSKHPQVLRLREILAAGNG